MGMLEDLLFGQQYRQPQYGGPWPEDISRLEEQILRMNQEAKAPLAQSVAEMQPDTNPIESLFKRAWALLPGDEDLGFDPGAENPLHQKAKERIEGAAATQAAEQAETERMQKAAYERQLDPESWVQPSVGSALPPADKLRKIAAEAKAKGRAGSLGADVRPTEEDYASVGGGGTFSQQRSSPELEARLADRDKWAAGQPERDMEFLASAEMARRNPELAMSAAGKLEGLRAQKTEERQVANQEALIGALSKGGKVPFSMALQMEASGMKVPGWAVGSHPDAAKREIDRIIAGAREDMQDPMTDMAGQGYSQYIISMGERYKQMIDSGMDPDEAGNAFGELVNRHAVESGAMDSYMRRMQAQQQAQGE